MATSTTEVPYRADGSLMRQVGHREAPEWRPNRPFAMTMGSLAMKRGRSSVFFVWQGDDGRPWPMRVADMTALIVSGTAIAGGTVTARWNISKRGTTYGIRLFEENA